MSDELLTKEACQAILGVGENAMTKYLREIRHFRLGNLRTGPIRVRRSDLEAWMERRMVAPQEEQLWGVRTGVRFGGAFHAPNPPSVATLTPTPPPRPFTCQPVQA